MPWEHPWLYPIQTILLVQPLWSALLWPVWTWISVRDVYQKIRYITVVVSLVTFGWSSGFFYQRVSVEGRQQILVANVNAYAGEQDMLQGYLSMLGVSKIVLLEKRAEEISGFKRVADDFDTVVKKPSHHTAVFCKEECMAWISPQIGSSSMSMSMALMSLSEQRCLVAVHIPPPTPIDATGMRPYVEYLLSVVENGRLLRDWEVCQQGDKVIVAGDFNAVSGSWAHSMLLGMGLVDAQIHSGIVGSTWPAESNDFVKMPVFRIDHVLHHPSIQLGVEQVRIPHSDHQGLLLSLP